MPGTAEDDVGRLQIFPVLPIRHMMDDNMLDPERISIPRWTIARDTRSLGCVFCHSIIVRVTTDTRQVAFCSCRLVEYRLLPKPNT
ncbi:MAG: hypothetical protein QG615_1083, partial [Nitrospirota bacterium]|nr:hypothetical protein [Nitrospirota bacterium]